MSRRYILGGNRKIGGVGMKILVLFGSFFLWEWLWAGELDVLTFFSMVWSAQYVVVGEMLAVTWFFFN